VELWLKIKEETLGHNRIAYDLQPEIKNIVRFFEAVCHSLVKLIGFMRYSKLFSN
jgi:hypothetical protein